MSHIVEIKTEVRDAAAVRAACQRLELPPPVQGTHRLFSGRVSGLGVQLPEWRYPAVCQLETGEIRYDNFGGHWGQQQYLDGLLQAYAVEKAKSEARRKGHTCTEQQLADGSIKLTVNVGGATGADRNLRRCSRKSTWPLSLIDCPSRITRTSEA
jgi:hypothetical protein